MKKCRLCHPREILFSTETSHVIEGDPHHHGHLLVVWKEHVEEVTELSPGDFLRFSADLHSAALIARAVFRPDRLNYALFGNWVPHIHWHIYPRYRTDIDWSQPPLIPWKVRGKLTAPPSELPEPSPISGEERALIRNLARAFK